MPTTSLLSRTVVVALAALMLCLPAAFNGMPFFYPDTPTYLRGAQAGAHALAGRLGHAKPPAATPVDAVSHGNTKRVQGLTSLEDKQVLAGRSVYYGTLLYLAQAGGSLWLAVAAQALVVAFVLHLLLVRLWHVTPAAFAVTVAALATATPLAVYTGLLMPDVFAGLGILAIAMLGVYWRQLGIGNRVALAAVLLFGLCAHASHVAVAAMLWLLLLGLRFGRADWQGVSTSALVVVAGCIAGALAAEWTFVRAVTQTVGAAPLRLPHPTARLIDMGPGTDYLRRHCPEAGYVVCRFTANYPTAWDEFLFSRDPARGTLALVDAETRRRVSAEQPRFVAAVVAYDPAGVGTGLAWDVLRQLAMFRVDVWSMGPQQMAMYAGRVEPRVYSAMQSARGMNAPGYNGALTAMTYASTFTALVLAGWWARRRQQGAPARVPQRMEQVAVVAVAGVIANALVCATAAASLDRFQARVIWLLPLLVLATLALAWRRQGTGVRRSTGPSVNPLREVSP